MIVRTPPPKRHRVENLAGGDASPAGSDRQLVTCEEPSDDRPSDHMLCTYQCRQMVMASVVCNSEQKSLIREDNCCSKRG